jgi:rod shape-determining protein MreD
MRSSIYVAIPLLLLLAVGQTAVIPHFPVLGLVAILPFLVVLSWTMLHGLEEGLVWAFIGGIWMDVFSIGPMGTTAIAYMVAVVAVANLTQLLPDSRFFMPMAMAALGSLIYLIVYLSLIRLLGFGGSLQTAVDLRPLILLNAGFMLPVYWLTYTADRMISPRRVKI